MKYLSDHSVDLSHLIENQFPQYVREDSATFIKFIKAYYESQELKNSPLDIAQNLIEYYNIGYYKKAELIENTKLNGNIADSATTITVDSTVGFPDKGYIQIDDEIVYYGSKTDTTFVDCVRGTSALVLSNIPLSQLSLTTSLAEDHLDNTIVTNIAYEFTSEFFRRIRSEIAVLIPENLVSELDLSSFFSRIRTFYASKGSLNSHAILFRILFNDKKIRFNTKTRGSGATLKIPNFDGKITGVEITDGGSGYDSRTSGSDLISPPIIEVFGSGTGVDVANPTAVLTVNSITSGVIDGVTITDAGQNYVGPITAFVRERDFGEEELVTSIAGTGSGIVESWDFNTGELTLTNIIGFFVNADELKSGSGEGARAYVDNFEIVSQDPEIEFPKDYLFRPSHSNFSGKKLARLEVISKKSNISDPSLDIIVKNKTVPPSYITFVQDQDSVFGVSNVTIESSEILKIDSAGKPTYEADIEINDDFNKIYLPASTQLVQAYNSASDTIITVDDASGFPTTKGQIYIDDIIIDYTERTVNQFLGCTVVSGSGTKAVSTEVVAYGRYRTRKEYTRGEFVGLGQERYFGENLYRSVAEGKASSTVDPTHTLGTVKVGTIEWEYIGSSKVSYFVDVFVGFPEKTCTGNEGELTIRVDKVRDLAVGQLVVGSGIGVGARIRSISGKELTLSIPNTSKVIGGCIFSSAQARLVGLVDAVTIEKSGALFSPQKYFFDDKTYEDFSGTEYSSWTINSDHTLDTDKDFVGISQIYNYKSPKDQHVYVSSSAIPGYIFSGSVNAKNRVLSNIFDGYTNAFNLVGVTNPVEKDLFIFRNALLQDPLTDYDVVNDVLVFDETPSQTEDVYIRYFNDTNKVTKLSFTQTSQGAANSTITLNGLGSYNTSNDYLFVTVNGVLQVGNAISYNNTTKIATFTDNVNTLTTKLTPLGPSQTFDVTNATYNAANGLMVLTIGAHGLTTSDTVRITPNSLPFTCTMDGNTSEKTYPRVTDPAYDTALAVQSPTATTITLNVGASPLVNHNVTGGQYDPISGLMVLTIGSHSLKVGQSVKIANGALKFQCAKDNYATDHSYPRTTDPVYNTAVEITAITSDSITMRVGTSTDTSVHRWKPSYTATAGIVSGGNYTHTWTGNTVKGAVKIGGTRYNPNTGVLTLRIANSNLLVGDKIKIADEGLTFRCAKDDYASDHSYPRTTDPSSGQWLEVTSISGEEHVVNVNVAFDTVDRYAHNFISSVTDSITRRPDKIVAYWIKNAKVLDALTSSASKTYTLQSSSSNYTTATTDTVFVAINGVIQKPTTSYTISGSTLTFNEVNSGVPITVIDLEDGSGGADIENVALTGLSGLNQDKDNYKLQKLVKRIPFPASVINENILRTSKSLSPSKTQKAIGITVDGIQYQSIHGNKVPYGAVKSITIGSGGTYEVPYDLTTSGTGKFLKTSYPKVIFTKNGGESTDLTINETVFDIAAGIKKIDINKFVDTTNLGGFTIKPNVEVISNNVVDPTGFRKAVVDVGYKNGIIDSFIVVDSGYGYIEAPTIKIIGGGKLASQDYIIPFFNTTTKDNIVTMEGPVVSSKSSSSTITLTTPVGTSFNANPVTTVDSGSKGEVKVFVANGKIVATQIVNKGQNYYTKPTLIVHGVGNNAVLEATLDGNGGLNGAVIINEGSGYTIPPVVTVKNNDTLAVASSLLNEWTFNIPFRFNTKIDEFGGYVFDENSGDKLKVASFTSSTLVMSDATTAVVVGMEATHPDLPTGTFVTKVDNSNKTIYLSRSGLDQVTNIGLNGSFVSFYQGDDRFRGSLNAQEVSSTVFPDSRLKFQYLQLRNTSKFEDYYGIVKPGTTHTATIGTTYDPKTGIVKVTTTTAHGLANGDYVNFADGSLEFSCNFNGATGASSQKDYPRSTDYASGRYLKISNVTNTTFEVTILDVIPSTNVNEHTFVNAVGTHIYVGGTSSNALTFNDASQKDVTDADYDPTTGLLELTIGTHTYTTSNTVTIGAGKLAFTCDADDHATTHTYPRATDPVHNISSPIKSVTSTTITVDVGSPKQQDSITSAKHSKLVGFSYDGHPIYCKYGYTTALDKTSGISEQTSSWRLKGNRFSGPTVADYPLGSFIEDYEYDKTFGTLDEFNGKFCVTPEYPDGAYCYFMVDTFPFVVGPKYFSDPDCYNTGQNRTNDQVPKHFIRVNDKLNTYFPQEEKNINKSILFTDYSSVGTVDGVFIEKAGVNYKVGDNLVFDNDDTGGAGATAYVSSVDSPPISSVNISNGEIEFTFSGNHQIAKGDVVDVTYTKQTTKTEVNLDTIPTIPTVLSGKNVYAVVLESHKTYRLKFGTARPYNLSFDILNFNPYYQEDINLQGTYFDIDPSKIPSVVFVHTDNAIFELRVEEAAIIGRHTVTEIVTSNSFIVEDDTVKTADTSVIDIAIRSKGASGPIKTINVVNGGGGYRVLPGVTSVSTSTGKDAIIQATSTTIGSINSIKFITYGDKFYGSKTVRNYVDLPITVKVKSNFEIESISVVKSGSNYLLSPYIRVNGLNDAATLEATYSVGEVVDMKVIEGGSGFSEEPTIEVFSQNGGSGATFSSKMRRKTLVVGDIITIKDKTTTAKILSVDTRSSTVELLVTSGSVLKDDVILSSDGRTYGSVVEVNTAKAYSKSQSFGQIKEKFVGSVGFISDSFQKLGDNVYYQDWAYSLSNNRNIIEWRKNVNDNTHPAGFRLFGKNRLHSRKSLLGRSQNIVRSAVTFKSTISSLLDADIENPKCTKGYIYFHGLANPNPYKLNDIVFGSITGNFARVIEVGVGYIVVLYFDEEIQIGEQVINYLRNVSITNSSSTDKTLLSVNGILQSPDVSYKIVDKNILPQFPIFPNDELVTHHLTTSFNIIKGSGVNNDNEINLTKDGVNYTASNSDHLIVSMNGVIQKSTNLSLINSGKTIKFTGSTLSGQSKPEFILEHAQLQPLTFTGSAGTQFTLNVTPSSDCKLLVFFVGVDQSHLLTDYTVSGSTITFSASVDPTEIFGWHINETVACEKTTLPNLYSNAAAGKDKVCNQAGNTTLKVYSDNVKRANDFFEIEKEQLDGTMFLSGSKTYGFGTKFKTSNPENSSSHVEIINDISNKVNGVISTFDLKINKDQAYTPVDGVNSLQVVVNGTILGKNNRTVTPTTASYTATTGIITLTVPNHQFANNDLIKFADGAITFTCGMDNNLTRHSYPRSTDPISGEWVKVSNVTTNTFDVQVGKSPQRVYTATAGSYAATSGLLTLTIGGHTLKSGDKIKIADNSLKFKCDEDNFGSVHTYPRTTIDNHTAESGTTYNPSTGIMTVKVTGHSMRDKDWIRFDDESIKFTCDFGQTEKSYPRVGDPVRGKWIPITYVDANTFTVDILQGIAPTNTTAHTFASATANGIKQKRDRAFDAPVNVHSVSGNTITLDVGISDNRVHQFQTGSSDIVKNNIIAGGAYTHTFHSATVGGVKSSTGYTISGTQITFAKPPSITDKISIKDFVTTYKANTGTKKGAELDEFNVANGVRKVFNISDDGVPETVQNKTDLFTIKNGILVKPDIHLGGTGFRPNPQLQSAVNNKVTFKDAPAAADSVGMMVFNRQLSAANKRNWVLDRNEEFDNVRKLFTLQLARPDHTKDWVDLIGVPTAESLIVVKNDKTLVPTTDYTIVTPTDPNDINDGSGSYRIQFTTAPLTTDLIHIQYTANDANFEDRTSELSQTSAKVLSYTTALTGSGWIPFCYVDGDYIDQGDVTHDSAAKTLTFTDNTTLASQSVEVHFKKATLNPTNVYGDILTGELIVKQRADSNGVYNNVEIGTTNNTYNLLLRNGSSNSTITGVKVVNILLRNGSTQLIIGSNHYRILTMNLNNPAMFDAAGATFVGANGIVLAPDDHFDHSGSGTAATTGIGDGKTYAAIQFKFYGYMNKGIGATWWQSDPRGMPYLAKIDIITHDKDDGDGRLRRVNMLDQSQGFFGGNARRNFRLEVDGVRYSNYTGHEDIIVIKNDIPLRQNTHYTLSGIDNSATAEKGVITFGVAPLENDDIYMVAMYDNELIPLTSVNSTTYTTSRVLTTAERESLIVFAGNKFKFGNGNGFTIANDGQTITFPSNPGTGTAPWGILATTGKVIDKVNTPFDSTETEFNMFLDDENFVPVGTQSNDASPDPNSLFVTKNGSLLIPTTDYTLQGTVNSRIKFNTAPAVGDDITISSQGLVKPLDNITGNDMKTYTIQSSSTDYYPNALIGRPRELENQVIAIKNNKVLDPIKDYYVFNEQITFTDTLTSSDTVRLFDWLGDHDDVAVSSYNQQVEVNETIQLPGETKRRTVTAVHSPTAISVDTPSGNTSPAGLVAEPKITDGELKSITISNGGIGYPQNTKFRTYGLGDSASANTILVPTKGNSVKVLTGSTTNTASNASYVPSTGILTLTIPHHGLSTNDKIKIADGSLTFTCSMDSYATEHKYPRTSTNTHSVSTATYEPSSGTLNVTTTNPHNLQLGDRIKIGDNALTFKCSLDNYTTTHTYPRSTDPFRDKWLPVSNIGTSSFSVNVGSAPLGYHTPTAVDYDPTTGIMIMNIGSHNIKLGDPIRINKESLTFTCTQDGNATQKSYPRDSVTYHTPSNASYDPTTGIMTVTINNHGFIKGEFVKFMVGALQFTCATDGQNQAKSYPRVTDPAYDTWLKIDNITTNTFTVQVLDSIPSTNVTTHIFAGADINGMAKKVDQSYETALTVTAITSDTISVNVLSKIPSTNTSVHTFVEASDNCIVSGGGYAHRFVSAASDCLTEKKDFASEQWLTSTVVDMNTLTVNVGKVLANTQYTPTAVNYDPVTGLLTLDVGSNFDELKVGKSIIIADNSLKFKCAMDGNDSVKSYPRPGIDKASGRSLPITAKSGNTITVDVGVAGTNTTFTPSNAQYNQATGDMVLFIGQHGLRKDANVVLVNQSLSFQCAKDGYISTTTYPRPGTDPFAGEKSIAITEVGSTEHTVTSASYDATNGLVTISVSDPSDKFANDDYVLIKDNALVFTCALDGNATQHSYPRPSFDYPSGRWMKISSKTHSSGTSTFNINVGSSTYTGTHTFVGAAVDALERQNGEITINVGFDSNTSNQYQHRFVSATSGAVKYTPNSTHTFQTGQASANNCISMTGDATHKFVRSTANGISVQEKTFVSVGDTVIDYVGHNLDNTTLVPTYESYVVRDQQLHSSDVTFGTKLSSGINTSVETIPVTGTGMASESNISITITSGSGSSAVLQPFVVDGKITKVEVETAGSGYDSTDITLTVTNGGGSGATLEPVLNSSGAFTSVTVVNEGIGYDSYRAFINKEVIEYTNHTTTALKGVTRGVAGSTAATGAQNDKVYFDS